MRLLHRTTRGPLWVLILLACALTLTRGVDAQSIVSAGTAVKLRRVDSLTVQGRLVRADSTTLTLETLTGTLVIPRGDVTELSRRSLQTGPYARRLALIGVGPGLGLGALMIAIAGTEHGPTSAAGKVGMLAFGGALGASLGALSGAVLGALVPTWTPLATSVGVAATRSSGAGGVELCNPRPSVEGSIGTQADGGGVTTRAAVVLTCGGRVTGGLEIGQLARRESESRSSSVDSFSGDTYTEQMSGGRTESFLGGFANIALGTRFLNPRFVASAGAYHEVAWSDQASSHTKRADGTTTSFDSHQQSSAWRPGVGVGLGVSSPVWQHMSLGGEARGHWSGNGNIALTTVLSMRLRP